MQDVCRIFFCCVIYYSYICTHIILFNFLIVLNMSEERVVKRALFCFCKLLYYSIIKKILKKVSKKFGIYLVKYVYLHCKQTKKNV